MRLVDSTNLILGQATGTYVQALGPSRAGVGNLGTWFNGNIVVAPGVAATGAVTVLLGFTRTDTNTWPVNVTLAVTQSSMAGWQLVGSIDSGTSYVSILKVDPATGNITSVVGTDLMNSGVTVANTLVVSGFLGLT
jgi:hypothetical protein